MLGNSDQNQSIQQQSSYRNLNQVGHSNNDVHINFSNDPQMALQYQNRMNSQNAVSDNSGKSLQGKLQYQSSVNKIHPPSSPNKKGQELEEGTEDQKNRDDEDFDDDDENGVGDHVDTNPHSKHLDLSNQSKVNFYKLGRFQERR